VTFRVSTASLKVTVTVLLATVWIGICTPCLISAAWLFWVVTFGVESSARGPAFEGGEGASRLKLPRMLPSEMPIAELKPRAAG
jgi:hypothetical protein